MIDLRSVQGLGIITALALTGGCGGSQSIPGTAGMQAIRSSPAVKSPPIAWVPANVVLTPNGKTKLATLEFLSRYKGVAYQIDCVGHFNIGRERKSVKHGIVHLTFPLTAGSGPYHCTWGATVNIGKGEQATSTLFIIVRR